MKKNNENTLLVLQNIRIIDVYFQGFFFRFLNGGTIEIHACVSVYTHGYVYLIDTYI